MQLDLAVHQQRSILQARRLGSGLVTAVLRSFRQGWGVAHELRKQMARGVELMTDSMLVSHLTGIDVERRMLDLSLSVHSKAIGMLRRRANMTAAELARLEEQYAAQAVRMLEGATRSVEVALQHTMVEITETGMHVREGIERLRATLEAKGITPSSSFQLEAMYRTQTQLAFSAGRWHADQDPDIQEILWGYKYVTAGDDRVRDEHLAMDGMQAPKDDVIWGTHFPPNGWACRCQAISITRPRKTIIYGDTRPDKGFEYNPGQLLAA